MKFLAQLLIVLISLGEGIALTYLKASIWKLGNAFGGSGDGAGVRPSGGGQLLATVIIEGLWLFLLSPYVCMVLGSLNLITVKSLRIAYLYSLALLSIMTIILLMIFHWPAELMALGNMVGGGLWAFYFRGAKVRSTDHNFTINQ
jgi:hypothetical protein